MDGNKVTILAAFIIFVGVSIDPDKDSLTWLAIRLRWNKTR